MGHGARLPELRLYAEEGIADNFAGGGGASTGIEIGLGRSPDYACNHDPEAIAMHEVNHPDTEHFCEDIWKVDPRDVVKKRLALAWFSPDCKHFSKAKGGKPVDKKIRGLAWVVIRWVKALGDGKPRVIILENVEEFEDWGPLLDNGRPCPERVGLTFRIWVGKLRAHGYRVEWRELVAADFGAPTTRKRLYLIARCDGQPIQWPKPTHDRDGRLLRTPWRTAAECIDWSIICPSIFERRRPLAENTERRIARGIDKFVLGAAEPFIAPVTHTGDARVHGTSEPMRTITGASRGELALVAPTLIQTGYGERPGQAPRVPGLHKPLGTSVSGVKHALVAAFLAKHNAGHEATGAQLELPMPTVTSRDSKALTLSHLIKFKGTCQHGQRTDAPMPTIQAEGWHIGEVRAFLMKFYSQGGQWSSLHRPMGTATARDRMALVTVRGEDYVIADIGMRMLVARELFNGNAFPRTYIIERDKHGNRFTATAQVRMVGNSVCPPVAAALARAQFEDQVLEVAA